MSITPSGIEPATFRHVAQSVNQLSHRVPPDSAIRRIRLWKTRWTGLVARIGNTTFCMRGEALRCPLSRRWTGRQRRCGRDVADNSSSCRDFIEKKLSLISRFWCVHYETLYVICLFSVSLFSPYRLSIIEWIFMKFGIGYILLIYWRILISILVTLPNELIFYGHIWA